MNILDSVANYFNSPTLTPHGYCLLWDPDLVALTVLGNLGIALAYLVIPLELAYVIRRAGFNFFLPTWVMWLFAVFIFLCATTHVVEAINVYYTQYWLSAILANVTAAASLITAFSFPVAIFHAINANKAAIDDGREKAKTRT